VNVDIRPSPPHDPDAVQLVHKYMTEVASRWYGRPAEDHEVARALSEEPATDLEDPTGCFAVAYVRGTPVGVGGVRFVDEHIAELTKVFTVPSVRGLGIGTAMLNHLERVAVAKGRRTIRLDTRSDLSEACQLYERRGYERVAPFNDAQYSDRWYLRRYGE